MTAAFDFDRLLASVLDSGGPLVAPVGLVDDSLKQAASVRQRQPFVKMLDQQAWPSEAKAFARTTLRRLTTLAVIILLVVAAIAIALLIGSRQPPRLLGDGERAFVSSDQFGYLVTADGVDAHALPAGRPGSPCAKLVGRTTVVGRIGFGRWNFTELTTPLSVASVGTNYAGSELWSPDAERLALVDLSGRIGVVAFTDPSRPATRWYAVPGLAAADWSLDGNRLAVLTSGDRTLNVEVIDLASGDVTTVHTIPTDPVTGTPPPWSIQWSSRGSTVAVLIVAMTTAGARFDLALVDLATGSAAPMPAPPEREAATLPTRGAWSPDGSWFAMSRSHSFFTIFDRSGDPLTTVATDGPIVELAWSPDSTGLAFRDGDRLVVVDRAGGARRSVAIERRAAFEWDRHGLDLVIARPVDGGLVMERLRGSDLVVVSQMTSTNERAIESGPTSTPASTSELPPICLQLDDVTARQ
jgi:hypothetical protein